MPTYAIGDIQGCHAALLRLLDKLNFDSNHDTLWFAGDLVNRGHDSLATLRLVKSLGSRALTVLGNHDLHLLAIAYGVKTTRSADLQRILDADDRNELLQWLCHRPLLHHDAELGFTIAHAGIYPLWSLTQAKTYAQELEATLQNNLPEFLNNMYGNKPAQWQESLSGFERLRFICNAFTRMRFCKEDGTLDLNNNGSPDTNLSKNQSANDVGVPWFEVTQRKTNNEKIVFGHWSTLGNVNKKNIYPLDTGCVWGGELTALRLEDEKIISVDCPAAANPADFIKK